LSAGATAVAVRVQRRLESFYALAPEAPVSEFVLEDAGAGSRTLVSEDADGLRVGVVLDAGLRQELLRRDPLERLDAANLDALCALTEEVSHFLLVLFCARSGRSATRLELELQGEVDKYLTAAFLMSLQNEGAVSTRLRELLFRNYRLHDDVAGESAARYHDASRLAFAWTGFLEERYLRKARLQDLRREARRFYRLGQRDKLLRIAAVS
jgi:hypothetical protein